MAQAKSKKFLSEMLFRYQAAFSKHQGRTARTHLSMHEINTTENDMNRSPVSSSAGIKTHKNKIHYGGSKRHRESLLPPPQTAENHPQCSVLLVTYERMTRFIGTKHKFVNIQSRLLQNSLPGSSTTLI